ncbi:uncharacterized protein LOC132253768 [Vitis vinifera]|uniref:uncharacterized protein LOC132253768 n=1 Tax=Vitis vinifera TaxID=29760 RepID=UPI0028831087|nr:uncharacterized protein LOC132253768 [Vitis vinifera]
MAKTRGAQTPSPSARNTRPRTSTMRDSMSEAPQASAIPPSEGGMPPSPSQRRYETRRPPTTPEIAVICAHQDQLIATQTQHTAILRQIHQHLGILSPPEHDMPGTSEPTDPSQKAPPTFQIVPYEETTIVEIETSIQSTQSTTAEPSSSHDPHTTT